MKRSGGASIDHVRAVGFKHNRPRSGRNWARIRHDSPQHPALFRPVRPGPGACADAGTHEHRQPQLQPGADPFRARHAEKIRRGQPHHLERRQNQGQPVCHAGGRQTCRRDPVGPHRHRALGRAGLVGRPAVGPGPRRQTLWARQRRHEKFHRAGAGPGGCLFEQPRAFCDSPGTQLRRGGRLFRRARAGGRHERRRHRAAGLHCGRAHQHGAGHRPQGCLPLPVLRARQGSPLVADAAIGQRHRDGRAGGGQAARHGRGFRAQRAALRGVRCALQHGQRRPVPWGHCRQCGAA